MFISCYYLSLHSFSFCRDDQPTVPRKHEAPITSDEIKFLSLSLSISLSSVCLISSPDNKVQFRVLRSVGYSAGIFLYCPSELGIRNFDESELY